MKPELTIDSNGTKYWRLNGEVHREDGPAVELPDGTKCWYLNGKRHRVDGPAIEDSDGTKYWYINGQHHRKDGPAVEYPNGSTEWWLNDKKLSKKKLLSKKMQKNYPNLYNNYLTYQIMNS